MCKMCCIPDMHICTPKVALDAYQSTMEHTYWDIIKQTEHKSQQHTSKESVETLTASGSFGIAVTL